MYLEFAGLPGSGKSTLSSALNKHLLSLPCNALSSNEAIIQCIRRRDDGYIKNLLKRLPLRVWKSLTGSEYALSEFVKLSSRNLEVIALISEILSKSNLDKLMIESIWSTIVKSFVEIQLVSQYLYDSEVAIMDEAFSQRCFTLFGYMDNSCVSDELIFKYAQLAPISNQVFWIVTHPQICVERFMLRYESRPLPYDFKLDKNELLDNFETGNRVLQHLTKALENQGKCVHRINGDGDINQSIAKICKIGSDIWLENI